MKIDTEMIYNRDQKPKSNSFSKIRILLANNQRRLNTYCETWSSPPNDLLRDLERETHLKTLAPQMMSGHLQGRILSLISRMKQPLRILEIGTFTGYATLCLAEGLPADGELITIEANAEMAYFIEKYKKLAGLEQQIRAISGRAEEVIPQLEETFDLVFIDAGKRDYHMHYDLIIDSVNPGGLILADNILWSGKVLKPETEFDKDTRLLHAFNKKIHEDERVKNIILPIRDGLMLIEKC